MNHRGGEEMDFLQMVEYFPDSPRQRVGGPITAQVGGMYPVHRAFGEVRPIKFPSVLKINLRIPGCPQFVRDLPVDSRERLTEASGIRRIGVVCFRRLRRG